MVILILILIFLFCFDFWCLDPFVASRVGEDAGYGQGPPGQVRGGGEGGGRAAIGRCRGDARRCRQREPRDVHVPRRDATARCE